MAGISCQTVMMMLMMIHLITLALEYSEQLSTTVSDFLRLLAPCDPSVRTVCYQFFISLCVQSESCLLDERHRTLYPCWISQQDSYFHFSYAYLLS